MNILLFIILSLAVWRITKILVNEVGPYHWIEKFRNSIINEPWSPIHCFKCMSMWVSFFLTLFFDLPLWLFILTWFAASAVAILLEEDV